MSITLIAPIITVTTIITTFTSPISLPEITETPAHTAPDISVIYQDDTPQALVVSSDVSEPSVTRDGTNVIAPPPPPPPPAPVYHQTVTAQTGPTIPLSGTTKEQIVQLAEQNLGVPYVFGGETPTGWDCSGYVKWVTKQVTGINLPHGVSGIINSGYVHEITEAEAEPGDLVAFSSADSTNYHIGIYVGNGSMVHAPTEGEVTKKSSNIHWSGSTLKFYSFNG